MITFISILGGAMGCGELADDGVIEQTFNPCQPLVITAGGELSAAQSESLDRAIALWNERAGLKLTRHPAPDAPSIPVFFKRGAAFVHGYYSDADGSVTINNALKPVPSTITLAHELGHAFGLHHIDPSSRTSVMNPANLSVEPTAADAVRLGELWPECEASSNEAGG